MQAIVFTLWDLLSLYLKQRAWTRYIIRSLRFDAKKKWFLWQSVFALRKRLAYRATPANQRTSLEFLTPTWRRRVTAAIRVERNLRDRPRDRIWMLSQGGLTGRMNCWAIVGARHGVAFTFPLIDRRIIDFVLSLPLNRLVDRGYSRQPFRNAMAEVLPELVRWRRIKVSPFPDMPLKLAVAKHRVLNTIERLQLNPELATAFDFVAIADALRDAPEGPAAEQIARNIDGGSTNATFLRAIQAVGATWLARYVDRHSPETPEVTESSKNRPILER